MARTKYVSLDFPADDWIVNALIQDGMLVRRGNQHMKGLYLTKEGSRWLHEWCVDMVAVGPRRAIP